MAGTVKFAKIDSPTARAKLIAATTKRLKQEGRVEPERGQRHWQTLITGRAHIGFERKPGDASGRWLLRRYGKNAKTTPSIGFHGLRHTWASLAVMAGVPLMTVAKNLGHVDTRMVEKQLWASGAFIHRRCNSGRCAEVRL